MLFIVVITAMPAECNGRSYDCGDNSVCLSQDVKVHGSIEYISLCYCEYGYKRDINGKCVPGE